MFENLSATQPADLSVITVQVQEQNNKIQRLYGELKKRLVGQNNMIEKMLIALITDGHVLLEGNPGLAKTLAVKTLASALKLDFQRVQFTPDLLPADLVGTMIFHPAKGDFSVKTGPLFSNFILADEINRAPAKVQSALLEAMAERQVTIADQTYPLPKPFMVMATQNPIEQDGTYPLPEAQLDRFMMKVILDYPKTDEELMILRSHVGNEVPLEVLPVWTVEDLAGLKALVKQIYMDEKIERYILEIVFATRKTGSSAPKEWRNLLSYGASPRASINLGLGAKALALIRGRAYVTPEDVKSLVFEILRHRIGLTFEAEAESITADDVIRKIVATITVP